MTNEQLWELFPILLQEHDPVYFIRFEAQRARLAELFSCGEAVRISHIGSTAVPGLISKPTVDILLELNRNADVAAVRKTLVMDGWLLMSDSAQPALRLSFNKGYTENGFSGEVYHLHVVYFGDHDELYFRDYLIAHPEIAAKYGQLKLSLQKKYRHDRDGYTNAKTEFIKTCTQAAKKEFGDRYF